MAPRTGARGLAQLEGMKGGGRALLEQRGEGGEVVQGGEEPPPPCRNEPYQPGIAKMNHIDPFSIYIRHNV